MQKPAVNCRTQKFISLVSPIYDLFVGSAIKKHAQHALGMLDKVKELSVLDVCTGTGILAEALWKEGAQVTGIDFSRPMLNQARKKSNNNGNITFKLMEASKLHFPDNSFDLVTISMGLHEMAPLYRLEALKEMKRVSRNRILIIDHCGIPDHPLWRLGISLVENLEGSDYHNFVRQDPVELLRNVGLEVLKREETGNTCFLICKTC